MFRIEEPEEAPPDPESLARLLLNEEGGGVVDGREPGKPELLDDPEESENWDPCLLPAREFSFWDDRVPPRKGRSDPLDDLVMNPLPDLLGLEGTGLNPFAVGGD